MSYADVSNPVVIQASKTLSANVDNYTRRMCIVSCGGSSLSVGSWKEIGLSQLESILNDQTGNKSASDDLQKKLNGFFSVAPEKKVMVVECGKYDHPNYTIADQVDVLKSYLSDADKKSYCHYVPKEWYWPNPQVVEIENSQISSSKAFIGLRLSTPEGQTLPEGVSSPVSEISNFIQTNIPEENLEVEYSNPGIVEYDKDTETLKALKEGETQITFLGKINKLEGETALIQIGVKVGAWDTELTLTPEQQTQENQSVSDTTKNGTKVGERDLSFLGLADMYNSMKTHSYFFIEMIQGEEPSVSEAFQTYKNKKSIFCIYDNLATNSSFPLASIILGICGSSRYDLSATQLGTPLNFKSLEGQNIGNLTKAMIDDLIQAPANFAGELAGNPVVFNGRYTDGFAWEYYYQWDVLEFEISLKLQTLLLNGVNSASSVIPFNQNGIDILKANIKAVLLLWQERGIITSFAKGLDLNTGKMIGEGDISSIDFSQYIIDNSEDYKNEVYKGFSFYVMIGRYPRQIVIEATLN